MCLNSSIVQIGSIQVGLVISEFRVGIEERRLGSQGRAHHRVARDDQRADLRLRGGRGRTLGG